jgi:autotransporter-associated beta strand protein
MQRTLLLTLVALLALASPAFAQVLAFPEAEGFGRFATGGRTSLASSTVYHVTNLNDTGAGSLRDALSQSNRFVVFDVGGIINLSSVVTVASNITIAGQTAPGGIQVYGNRVAFHGANNLISRHWAVRGSSSMGRNDTASLVRGQSMIWDHMSITWGVDSNFDINPDSGQIIDNLTIQNSIIGQGLDSVGHSTGQLLQPGDGRRTSIIKNLYTDNATRNPKVKGENEFINNVVYGWESAAYIMGGDSEGISHANAEGNYFIYGVANRYDHTGAYININPSAPFSGGNANFDIYGNDNWVDGNRNGLLDGSLVTSYPGSDVVATPHAFPTTASMTAQQAVPYVMANVGPNITRDVVDTRLVSEVNSYGAFGGVILRESDLFPSYGTNPAYLNPRARLNDTDNDGMADNWETARGLNPANSTDWKNLNGAGYARLEEYINELGSNGNAVTSTGGAWTTPAIWTGGTPNLATTATVTGNLTVASGNAFARRLSVNGSLGVTGGTLDVFDTLTLAAGPASITGGAVTAGRVILSPNGDAASLTLGPGTTLQSSGVTSPSSAASFAMNGATFRSTGTPDIRVPLTIGAAGATIDTTTFSGQIIGGISGAGGLTKKGTGTLTMSGNKTYAGPTNIEAGSVIVTGGNLNQSSGYTLGSGTTLNVSSVGGLSLGSGKSLAGAGSVVGNVVASAGSTVVAQGSVQPPPFQVVAIQAESMTLGSDWAVFNNAQHGTGAGGSYNGADLNGGGIVMLSNAGAAAPATNGVALTTVQIPATKTYYLYSRTVEPTLSPIPGDPATQPGGNNSFWVSNQAASLQATTASYEEVQTYASPGNIAQWNLLSTGISPLSGVVTPINPGITYSLTAGSKTFSVYGRESGTILDGFVLSDTNLTGAQLDLALSGSEQVMTVTGNFQQSAGSIFQVEVAGGSTLNKMLVTGSATLAGDLAVSLASGFTPQPSAVFTILDAGSMTGQFANAAGGTRVPTADLAGSFLVNYDAAQSAVKLSSYAAAIPGDFNFDLSVDHDDLVEWSENYGTTMNGRDFLTWQRNFGTTAQTATNVAIPEPSSAALLFLAAMGLIARRKSMYDL